MAESLATPPPFMSEESASIPFRSAPAAPASPSTAVQSGQPAQSFQQTSDNSDVTPFIHQELLKQPYAVQYFDLKNYFTDPMFPDVREQAQTLDDYVIQQAKNRGLTDTKESYKEVVDALFKEIGKSTNEDPTKTLKRLSTAAGAMKRLAEAKLQPVLSAQNLSPSEFEDIQP